MKKFLSRAWEEMDELILHLFTSGILIICIIIEYSAIHFISGIFFSENNHLISLLELSSQGIIVILFLVYIYRGFIRAIEKIK